jgi:hypothetical protein
VFEALNKSLLVYASTRYEMARCFSDARPQVQHTLTYADVC